MSYDFPTDLIRQVQILTRKEAGLSDYDPNDPTLPTLPSVSATIATLDPSPPHLRCKHCRGRLLRGLQSVICIYCGQKQHREEDASAPDPISFNSTVSYRWLLQSLRLDGSEKVGPPIEKGEKTEVNRGHSTPKDNICLSQLLDLKISLFNEQENSEIYGADKEPKQGNSSLSYTGIDVDNFFSRPKVDSTSDKQPATSHPVENEKAKPVATHDYSLFQNVQSFQPAATTSVNNKSDDFSGWEADFMSADSGAQSVSKTIDPVIGSTDGHESQVGSSKSSNAFVDSAIDLSAHMDSVFGSDKNLNESKKGDESIASHETSNWSSDDLWSNATTEVFQQKGPFDPNVEVKDSQQQSLNTPITVDWFQDEQWPTNVASAPNPNATSIDEDSFDDWNDFTSSSTVKDPRGKATTQNDNQADVPLDTLVSDNATAPNYDDPQWISNVSAPNPNATKVDEGSFGDWNDFTSSSTVKDPQGKATTQNDNQVDIPLDTLVSDDATAPNYGDPQWLSNVSAPNPNATNIDEDSFDDWNDFASSSTVKDPQGKATTQNDNQADVPLDTLVSDNATAPNYDDPQWLSNVSAPNPNATNIDEDSFDDWNAFASSSTVKDPWGNAITQNDNQADVTLDTLASNNATAPNNGEMIGRGDAFEDWNDFTASTILKDPQAKAGTQNDNHVADGLVNTSELNLFSSDKFGDMDFGSSAHSDLFSSSLKESVSEVGAKTIWQDHPLDSIVDVKSNLNGSTGKSATDGDTFNTSTQPENDMESLFAQMHDLSFMLETNLSIPPKTDAHSSPQD